MKAFATLKNMDCDSCKKTIVRNLSRILDIRIIDIDIEKGILCFQYNEQKAFDQVKNELIRIGYPIQKCYDQLTKKKDNDTNCNAHHLSISRTRRPNYAFNL